ncbi:MAG: cytochrome c [Pyrinomonadaceae bacterium]
MKRFLLALAVCALAFGAFACAEQTPQAGNTTGNAVNNSQTEPGNAAPTNATSDETAKADAAPDGEKLYSVNCSRCHKADGKGGEFEFEGKKFKAEDLTSDKLKKDPDSEYIEVMTEGIPDEGMPSFGKVLNPEQMNAVVKYVRENFQK